MSEQKLKPCPFCGCDNRNLYFVISKDNSRFYTFGIFCNGCKQKIVLKENEWDTEEAKARAIEAWNRRTSDDV